MKSTASNKIKNFENLASSPLRRQALEIAEAGLAAIGTRQAVRRQFLYRQEKNKLAVSGREFDLSPYKNIIVVGFGKAAFEAVSEIQKILGGRIRCGYVIDLRDGDLGSIVCRTGTHPLPTVVNVQATKELVEMLAANAAADTLVICVVSGGGSALLCDPHDISCEAEVSIISALTVKGATIQELNTVRKHISRVKGGQLAKLIYPSACISLIFSDVPGDDLSSVASGPTVMDSTSSRHAAEILKKYDVLEACRMPSCNLIETPKEEKYFQFVNNILFVSAGTALAAMREKAGDLGYDIKIFSDHFQGEARELAQNIIAEKYYGCLLGAGESTVNIKGGGRGGRNQELALAALPLLGEKEVLLTLASDGRDNTEAAGAIVDSGTMARARALGLEPQKYLDNNGSFDFFEQLGEQLLTGPTGSNVSDLFVRIKL